MIQKIYLLMFVKTQKNAFQKCFFVVMFALVVFKKLQNHLLFQSFFFL